MPRYTVVFFLLLLLAAPLGLTQSTPDSSRAPAEHVADESTDPLSPTVQPTYRDAVYGDVVMAGNSVLRCPTGDETAGDNSPADCKAATRGQGPSSSALLDNSGNNDGYYMYLADRDDRAETFDSSSAEVTIPDGATVKYAQLNWGGHTGTFLGFAGINCIRPILLQGEAPPPPAAPSPETQQVDLSVDGGDPITRGPDHFRTTDGLAEPSRIYTAWSDVTDAFAHAPTGKAITLSVSNVWAPTGPGCAGGWSIEVVYDYGQPHGDQQAPRVIDIYADDMPSSSALLAGLIEPLLPGVPPLVDNLLPGLTPALTGTSVTLPGVARNRSTAATVLGVTAFDGDWRQGGDTFTVDDQPATEPCSGQSTSDFFRSCALGALDPLDPATHPVNNMSVDAKTVQPALTDNGSGDIKVGVNSVEDFVVVQSIVLAETVAPQVSVQMTGPAQAVTQGDLATFQVQVSNTGSLPLSDLSLHLVTRDDGNADSDDDGIRCTPTTLPALQPGESTPVTCVQPARVQPQFTTEATVTGTYLTGTTGGKNTVSATASATVQVLPAPYTVERVPDKLAVGEGKPVTFSVRLTNNTESDLTDVVYQDVVGGAATDCKAPGTTLSPGKPMVFDCVTLAPAQNFDSYGVMTGTGQGQPVTARSQQVTVTVIHPAVTVKTTADKDTLYLGDTVGLTFDVTNTGTQASETLTDIAVSIPDTCKAPVIPSLDPGASVQVKCTARPTKTGQVELTAKAAAADINGDPVTGTADPVTLTVLQPLITLAQAVDQPIVRLGNQAKVTFTVTHTGTAADGPVTGVKVSSPTLPDCSPAPLAQLEPGKSATFECTAKPDRTFDNQAVATATDGANRAMRVGTKPLRVNVINPSLTISTTVDPPQAKHGEQVDFSVTVHNVGDVAMDVDVHNDTAKDCDFPPLHGDTSLHAGAAYGMKCTVTTPADESVTEFNDTASYTAAPVAALGDTGEPLTGADGATVTLEPGKAAPKPGTGVDPVTGAGATGGSGGTGGSGSSNGGSGGSNGSGGSGGPGHLAWTGVSTTMPLVAGISLLAIGIITVAVTARRRDDSFWSRWWPGN
ncbi:CARDB domain-containing protein [Labedaea rhizosphaerae]|uniref:CARDB protein n=1 Tax=Labedaea rhizosphaerae TaxID=598644 RepID=A0A4R6SII9_LABRH|nr:CARDB domain-containing protein [Labedaea rhizosphaerae]TDQ00798.1 CARDB protein [Labedaea rhizosphaerae]